MLLHIGSYENTIVYCYILLYSNILENEAKRDFFTDFAFHLTNILQPSDQETVELVSPWNISNEILIPFSIRIIKLPFEEALILGQGAPVKTCRIRLKDTDDLYCAGFGEIRVQEEMITLARGTVNKITYLWNNSAPVSSVWKKKS